MTPIDATHPGPILLLLAIALLTFSLLDRLLPIHIDHRRIQTIDALKGPLAFGVFLYHACIWHYYLQSGTWATPPSRIYTHLGQSTVSLFFMITGHLYFSKLIRSREQGTDWRRFYLSRLLRITPMWAAVMVFTLIMMGMIRHFGLDAENPESIKDSARMLLMTAGVTWTLKYEWNFYFALPLLALLASRKPPAKWLVVSLAYLLLADPKRLTDIHAATFLGGMASAWLGSRPGWLQFCQGRSASALACAALIATVTFFDVSYAPVPTLLLSLAFALIANGADLFGLLRSRLSSAFGEITYSIYLLHGPLLFLTFRFVIGFDTASTMSALSHWIAIGLLTPVLIATAFASYRYIEMPAVSQTSRLINWSNKLLGARSRKPYRQ